MAAKAIPLTNTQVKQVKPDKSKVKKLSDGDGLQLLIKPNGSKIWHLRYMKPVVNKQTTLSLGAYPAVSLAQARDKRKEARVLLADGIDPKNFRDDELTKKKIALNNSFQSVFNEWFEIKETVVQPKQSKLIIRAFENHLFKDLGAVPIAKLEPQQVIDVIKKVELQKKHDLTKRLCSRINEVMDFAVNTGRIKFNPLSGITKAFKKVPVKSNPAVMPEQLPWLLNIIRDGDMKKVTRCLIHWQLHTMIRPKEAALAEWSEIDFENKLWNIPAERMKKPLAHSVPLTEQTLKILDMLKPITGQSKYIFASFRKANAHINRETVNKNFRSMELGGIQSAHGLRRVASTTLNEQGYNYDVIETSLAHVEKNQVRRVYNQATYLDRRRALMMCWSNHIEECAKGNYSSSGSTQGLKLVNG